VRVNSAMSAAQRCQRNAFPGSLAWCWLAIACWLAMACEVCSQDSQAIYPEPDFTATRVDGREISGRVVGLSLEKMTLVDDANHRLELPLRSLVKLVRNHRPPLQALEASHVLLPEGDRLMRVVVGSTTNTSIDVQCYSALGKLQLPLDCVLGLMLMPPSDTVAFDRLWDQLLTDPRSTEVVWLSNGDRVTGSFLGMDDRFIKLQLAGGAVQLDRSGAIAIGFDPALVDYPIQQTDFLEFSFVDGSRLGVVEAALERGQVTAQTRFGQSIQFPFADVIRIDVITPVVTYLSEREPAGVQYVPYVGPTRPFRRNRTVDGRTFQLAGQTYDRGLGTQSRTLLAYRVEPGDQRFQALVGVDERAGPLGSVVFRVLTDSTTRFSTPPMTARDAPRAVDVDLSGARLLILITEFGERGDVRDLADWVEARIIR